MIKIGAAAMLGAALLLAACDRAAETADDARPANPFELACRAPFVADASAASMREAFGAENVVEEVVPGPEGTENSATVLFPNDPQRRLEILWADAEARTGLLNASVTGEQSAWVGREGIQLGSSLETVEQANAGPFQLAGFSWDYAGVVTDWRGGALAPGPDGCTFGVQFTVPPQLDAETGSAIAGDGLFSSDDANMRKAKPTVVRMALGYPASPAVEP